MRTLKNGAGSVGLLALLAGAAACAAGRPPVAPAPPLLDVLQDEIGRQDGLVWSGDRPLTPADFKGVSPAAPGQEGARTVYSLFNGAVCTGQKFQYGVIAAVLPALSWMTPAVRASADLTRRTLSHEQTHFNLAEVHARRLRKAFADLKQPCSRTETQLQAISDRVIREEAQEQKRYDEVTNNGRTAGTQAQWEKDVAARLATLTAYGKAGG
jgi:hypothetical protein